MQRAQLAQLALMVLLAPRVLKEQLARRDCKAWPVLQDLLAQQEQQAPRDCKAWLAWA